MAERERKPPVRVERRRGRVETALEGDLLERRDIGKSERASLRAGARAVDLAEAQSDADMVVRANDGYLRLRVAAGLTAGGSKPVDAFDALLADIARAGAGDRDTENT